MGPTVTAAVAGRAVTGYQPPPSEHPDKSPVPPPSSTGVVHPEMPGHCGVCAEQIIALTRRVTLLEVLEDPAAVRMAVLRQRDATWVAALRTVGVELPDDAAPEAAARAVRAALRAAARDTSGEMSR